ncbi:MAG: PadR family transcriptional regulator [Acidimicrobiales bacterium]|nr:PadR family transcriptional regulator [Acidimicrobiales bacterium]
MIDLAILGLLTEQELHGYELKKRLGELLSSRASVSFGSLYPALARLEAQGAVKAVEERTSVPSAPMSGSLVGELAAFRARVRESGLVKGTGRGKKVYGITEHGRERLVELLSDPDVTDDRAFTLRVAFAPHLPDAARLELFERRRTELLRRRDDLRRRESDPGRAGRTHSYLRALLERDAENLAHDLAWLDRLIEAERSADHNGADRSIPVPAPQAHLQEETP